MSVTMPTVCDDPRSPSLVTTAGLMSMQTTRTADGSMLPTPMPCSMLASISTSETSLQTRGVAILRLDEVHDRIGQRTIVADAAGQHVVDAALLALVHDSGRDDALLDGLRGCRPRAGRR